MVRTSLQLAAVLALGALVSVLFLEAELDLRNVQAEPPEAHRPA